MSEGWEERVGGKLEFIPNMEEAVKKALEHIDKERAALGLVEYNPARMARAETRSSSVMVTLDIPAGNVDPESSRLTEPGIRMYRIVPPTFLTPLTRGL
jgi:hypothetical protein